MEQRPVGSTGVNISSVGLGTDMFGGRLDGREAFRILDYALDKGITYLDTAEWYGNGMSERIIGNWMRQRKCRDQVTVLTKFFPPNATTWGDRAYIRQALDASLSRLQSDYVDIYMMHFPDPNVPIEETLSTLSEEVEAGRVRAPACSNFDANQLQQAMEASASGGYQPFAAHQPEYNLVMPPYAEVDETDYVYHPVGLYELEDRIFPLCQRENIASAIYSPLGGGFLTGQYSRGAPPPEGSRAVGNNTYTNRRFRERNFQILGKLQAKADELGASVIGLAMAWSMTHQAVTSAITGARTLGHVDNAVEASEMSINPDLRAEMTAWTR